MKTEIIETYQTFEGKMDFTSDFMIAKVLSLSENSYALLKTKQREDFIEIRGDVHRTIEISSIIPKSLQLNHTGIFSFKKGLGYMDHENSKLILWENLEAAPVIGTVLKAQSFDLDMRKKSMAFVSYNNADNTFLIGINDKNGDKQTARFWTIVRMPELKLGENEINLEWDNIQDLNPEFYPKTAYNHQYPGLEWLNIIDMIKIDSFKYCYTTGGSLTRMRSGPEYEFSILSKIDSQNQVIKNIEIEKGKRYFSTNKKFLIVRPKSKKRLFFYDLNKMQLAFEIPLKPKNNMGEIDGNRLVSSDLFDDKLYVYSLEHLNICKLIK